MCELGRGYLNPALNALRHGPVSFMCPHGLPAGAEVSPASILPVTTVKWGRRSSSLARTATSSDARYPIGTVGLAALCSLPASAARMGRLSGSARGTARSSRVLRRRSVLRKLGFEVRNVRNPGRAGMSWDREEGGLSGHGGLPASALQVSGAVRADGRGGSVERQGAVAEPRVADVV